MSFLVLQSSRWGRESLVRWYVLNFVSLVFFIFLVVQWVGLSYVIVALSGHTHLPFGFPVASQAKYVCELDIRYNDEQEHRSI